MKRKRKGKKGIEEKGKRERRKKKVKRKKKRKKLKGIRVARQVTQLAIGQLGSPLRHFDMFPSRAISKEKQHVRCAQESSPEEI